MSRSEAIESDVDLAYQAKLNGLEWPPFETRPAHDRVIRVALAASGKNKALTVSIRVKGPVGISDARAVADGEAARVVNKLAVVLNEPIGDPVRISEGWTIRGADGPQHHHVTSGSRVGVRAGGEAWVIRGPRAVEDLVIELEQVDLPDCDAELFRTLLSVDEVVAKFLALYVVIAGRLGDNRQRDVDDFIRTEYERKGQPVAESTPVRGDGRPGKSETVYTRLRNQIAHDRGVPLESTRAEMSQNMRGLIDLVKACLRDHPSARNVQ